MRNRVYRVAAVAATLVMVSGAADAASPVRPHAGAVPVRALEVLVTNDDGVKAAGIDAVVEALRAVPGVHVTVVAPATNQSGTGDATTTAPVAVADTTTASGFPAVSVGGKPADTVLYAVKALGLRPDLVVSGANFGQNIADFAAVSGTVGAARTAGRLGIPSIAVSAGFGAPSDFQTAADYVAAFVVFFRPYYLAPQTGSPAKLFNLNTPTCTSGAVRGIAVVPVGRIETISGYTALGGGQVQATTVTKDALASDCASTVPLTSITDDIDAMNNGFASLSILNPDLTSI